MHSHLKIVQSEGSKLTAENLSIGLESMVSENREKWLSDIKEGLFKIVRVNDSV